MATTSPDNIYYPLGTDQVAPLQTVLSTMSTSVQTALSSLGSRFPITVASDSARNNIFPTPVQGARVYRSDKGYHEAYFAQYNASSNPGGARVAGWYPIDGNIIGKASGNPNVRIGSNNQIISFSASTATLNGMWSSGVPFRLFLPIIGVWELKAFATTSGGDGGLLRTAISVSGSSVTTGDLRDNVTGLSGLTDPFGAPHNIYEVSNTTSYAEVVTSSGGKEMTVTQASLYAKYLGPGRF